MVLTRVISTALDSIKRRFVKVRRFGKTDIQTAAEALPYGVDSNPINGMVAIYSDTETKGNKVIVGYINIKQLASPGEVRLYCTNSNGDQQFYIWLKDNGTLELGGTQDNAIRFNPLNQAMIKLAADIQAQLVLIAAGIVAGGGTYTPGTISIDISAAKINEVKTL